MQIPFLSGTPLNNVENCLKYCKELLLCHSVRVCRPVFDLVRGLISVHFPKRWLLVCASQRPPFSINLFSLGEVTTILKYISNNYLRHYKFYKYVFTPQVHITHFFLSYSAQSLTGNSNLIKI